MISIIIPTLNEEVAIEKTLMRLQDGLKRIPHEIIVTDGGSVDRTQEVARRYGALVVTDPRPQRQTIARGRNLGVAQAKGEYVVCIDADVAVPDPDRFFSRAIGQFERDHNLVGMTVVLRVRREEETFVDRFIFGCVTVTHTIMNNVLHIGSSCGEFQMIRTAAFRQTTGYREDLPVSEDNEFFTRLAKIGRTHIDRGLTVFHTRRRIAKVGWPRLLWSWFINGLWVMLFNRSFNREWQQVRLSKCPIPNDQCSKNSQ